MKQYKFVDEKGTFELEQPENTSYLYFPIAGEQGMKSSVTPLLGGDSKLGQNQFLLQPVSAEELHNNKSSRNFWCLMENGDIWSAAGVSAESFSQRFTDQEEESNLTAGIMWHQMERTSIGHGLHSVITSFVPVCDWNVEVMQVELTNKSGNAVSFTPAAAVPLYARSADNVRDHRHVTSLLHRIATTEDGVTVTPALSFDERGHQRNQTAYYVCGADGMGEKPVGFYPVVEDFIGEGGNFERPAALLDGTELTPAGTNIDGYEAMGGIVFKKEILQAGETKSYIILMGITEDQTEIKKVVEKFGSYEKSFSALQNTKKYWDKKINVSYGTGDSDFNQFMHWVSFQPMLRRIYGCSFLPHHDYGKGGRGWRDLWQDCLALLIMNPDGVREMLIDNFAGIRIDGTNATIIGNRQGEFIADRNSITRVWMDHGVWPLITTGLYVNQTGDLSILLKRNTYFKDKQAVRGTDTDPLWNEKQGTVLLDTEGRIYQGTILEHLLLQNLTAFYEVGEHNHIRLRGADWNDAMDMAPDRGESVAFTSAYAGNLEMLADFIELLAKEKNLESIETASEMEILFQDGSELYENIDKKKELLEQYARSCVHHVSGRKAYLPCRQVIESLRHKSEWIKEHIRKNEWIEDTKTGGWFNGYYDNHGRAVEGYTDDSVRMMLTGQVFTIMSGTATKEQTEAIIKSADRYLYEESVGGYRLNTDFKELKTDMGRMFGFAYGHKENGAVFSHMTTMYANALYKRGFAKEGYKALHTLCRHALNFNVSKIYPGIPEYFNDRGRGMYHYLTGAASWYMLTVITEMFGVKGAAGTMYLEPKLLKEQFDVEKKADIFLTFGKRKWHIIYVNEEDKEYGEYSLGQIFLNGGQIAQSGLKNCIPADSMAGLNEELVHEIIAVLN